MTLTYLMQGNRPSNTSLNPTLVDGVASRDLVSPPPDQLSTQCRVDSPARESFLRIQSAHLLVAGAILGWMLLILVFLFVLDHKPANAPASNVTISTAEHAPMPAVPAGPTQHQ